MAHKKDRPAGNRNGHTREIITLRKDYNTLDKYKTILEYLEEALKDILNVEQIPTKYRDALHESALMLTQALERMGE